MIPKLPEDHFAAIGKIVVGYNNIELMLRYAFGSLIFDIDDGLAITELMHTSSNDNMCAGIRYLLHRRCNILIASEFEAIEKKIATVTVNRNKLAHSFVINSKKTDEEVFLKLRKKGSNKKNLGDFIQTEYHSIGDLQRMVEEVDTTVQEIIHFTIKLQEFIHSNFQFQSTTKTNFKAENNE